MPNQDTLSSRTSQAGTDTSPDRTSNSSSTASEAAEVAKEAKQQVTEQALAAKERAVQRGKEFADSRKHQAASEVEVFGAAIRQAANKLDEEGQESVACYAEACADEFDRAAGYLRDRDFGQLYRDASQFAKKRPEIFLGGMFIAGLAVSRFLKASDSQVEPESSIESEEWETETSERFESDRLSQPTASTTPTLGTPGTEQDARDEPATSSAFESNAPTRPGRPR